MDWKFSFVPNDVLDLSARDLQSKVNPKIILTIRLGKGMIGAGMPILLEDITFKGHLRLKFKMFNEFPHIKTVEASFLEKPYFDYSLKPVGGETFGFDINNVSLNYQYIIKEYSFNYDLLHRFLVFNRLSKNKSMLLWVQ
jgi:Ca2+-dependent lipid-binding protein